MASRHSTAGYLYATQASQIVPLTSRLRCASRSVVNAALFQPSMKDTFVRSAMVLAYLVATGLFTLSILSSAP